MDGLPSILRQQEVASVVSQQVHGGEQAQRQLALSQAREAEHRAGMVAASEGSQASANVGDDGRPPEQEADRRGGLLRGGLRPEELPPLKDAPNPGPLGHHFDIIA